MDSTVRQTMLWLIHSMTPSVVEWSGGAMVLGKLPVLGHLTGLDNGSARACCACTRCGLGCLDIFTLVGHFSFSSVSGRWPNID